MFEAEYVVIMLGFAAAFLILGVYCYEIYKKVENMQKEKRSLKSNYKFEVFKDKKKEWRFRFVAPNGEIIATSEGYKNRNDCISTIKSIKKNAQNAEIIKVC